MKRFLVVQYQHLPQLNNAVIPNHQQCEAGKRNVDIASGANDEVSALLSLQRTSELSVSSKHFVDALEIAPLAGS